MEALAQEAADSAAQQAPGWVAQLQAAGVPVSVIAGLAIIAAVLFGLRQFGFLKANGIDKDWLGERFDNLGHQMGEIKSDVTELKSDFKEHVQQDRESFRDLFDRTPHREQWTQQEREQRVRSR